MKSLPSVVASEMKRLRVAAYLHDKHPVFDFGLLARFHFFFGLSISWAI
jgi:hypothetical protein